MASDGIAAYRRYEISGVPIDGVGVGLVCGETDFVP